MLSAVAASAATFTWTEGNGNNRKLVAGSIDLNDANSNTPGFDLGAFTAADALQVHGRIVGSQDVFSYSFTMSQAFNVSFDLDGYALALGGFESNSGLVGQKKRGGDPTPGEIMKGVKFTLTGGGSSESRSFATDILSGADPFILSGDGNTVYTLTIDGSVGPAAGKAALYDLRIAAVSVPAAGLLLISAVAGMGAMARRRKHG
ncbi:MAG: VPLPA-CTERM sorting domain-containing protein [Pseudomonadota bacterium]